MFDKVPDNAVRPRYLIYDIMQFEVFYLNKLNNDINHPHAGQS